MYMRMAGGILKKYTGCHKIFLFLLFTKFQLIVTFRSEENPYSRFSESLISWSSGLGAGSDGVSPEFRQLCKCAARHFAYLSPRYLMVINTVNYYWKSLFLLGHIFIEFTKNRAHIKQHSSRVKCFDHIPKILQGLCSSLCMHTLCNALTCYNACDDLQYLPNKKASLPHSPCELGQQFH